MFPQCVVKSHRLKRCALFKMFGNLYLYIILSIIIIEKIINKMASFDISVTRTLRHEGGYQDNEIDRGNYVSRKGGWPVGKYPFSSPDSSGLVLVGTNKGITAFELYKHLGRLPSAKEMRNLSTNTAKAIYRKNYWNPLQGDRINNQSIADVLFDAAVNQGVGFAARAVQRAVNVSVDGVIGPKTIAAINAANQKELYLDLLDAREKQYTSLPQTQQDEFLEGWLKRLATYKDFIDNNTNGGGLLASVVVLAATIFFLTKN